MYKIEKRPSGFLLTFGGFITAEQMKEWVGESRAALQTAPPSFGVIVDMRTLVPLESDAQQQMVAGQKLYKDRGLKRSAVILNNAVTTMQFRRLAKESGISAWERYIDASANPDWPKAATAWVKDGVDPDRS
jgi:hypothetical protein